MMTNRYRSIVILAVIGIVLASLFLGSETSRNTVEGSAPPESITNDQPAPLLDEEPIDVERRPPPTQLESGLDIQWRERPRPAWNSPKGDTKAQLRALEELAENGDGFAAHRLANRVIGCDSSFRSTEELESAIKSMRETFVYTQPGSDIPSRASNAQEAEIFVMVAMQGFETCSQFEGDFREHYLHWLEIAANNNHTIAMLDYANTMHDRLAAVELIEAAWHLGESNALLVLANTLNEIYQNGLDPTAKVPAAAAMHAFVELHLMRYSPSNDSIVGQRALRYQQRLSEIDSLLLPHERDAAREQARTLIKENENCCF
ncbi:MAG: hypothetical protein AAGH76_05165 [Pseudomonadota bacterium]